MKDSGQLKIGLAGNPNSGKSSLFNYLTGLNQHVSNFPGVTVDKKTGKYQVNSDLVVDIIDLPGTYSMFPNSTEEKIVINILCNNKNDDYPDLIVYVADITQLEKHLLFASQIRDLEIPMILVLNMIDLVSAEQQENQFLELGLSLKCQVVAISLRENWHLDKLKNAINNRILHPQNVQKQKHNFIAPPNIKNTIEQIQNKLNINNPYRAKLIAHHFQWLDFLTEEDKKVVGEIVFHNSFENIRSQVDEVLSRYEQNNNYTLQNLKSALTQKSATLTDQIDRWLTHRLFGPIVFFGIMIFVFQAIFSWSTYPMDKIEGGFAFVSDMMGSILPQSWWSGLLTNGLLPGLAGVLVFVPQIAILFLLISMLEESGYMSRVVYMFDGIMQKFGMNGRSMVALISSGACAIPAIMSTRTISNTKERLITILVSPLISCSARLPVYAVLIGFVVPSDTVFGIFNKQGLVFMGLYLLSIMAALVSGLVFKQIIKSDSPSFLMIELPNYKPPVLKNILLTVKEKVWSFITGAGQIIIVISLLLYFLASYGPGDSFIKAENNALAIADSLNLDDESKDNLISSLKLESSYIGLGGKFMEPAIAPLGFDWKIGIALITSFAAREVFVGTMATIYSLGGESDEKTIRQKMADEVRPDTGQKVYDMKTSMALLIFYVFALQCMSTLAVTKKETNSWKWPVLQFLFMGLLAYAGAFIAYRIF